MKMNFKISGDEKNGKYIVESRSEDGIVFARFLAKTDNKVPESVKISFSLNSAKAYSTWSPALKGSRSINPDWNKQKTESGLAVWLPIHQILSQDGKNIACVALSDPKIPVTISTGFREEDALIYFDIEFFTKPVSPMIEYTCEIRVDLRDIPFYDAIYDGVSYIDKMSNSGSCYVPEYAKLPMDSLWYSFHQHLSFDAIINECKLAAEIGLKTVIIDDGWQTDDETRGYSYCGDWRPSFSKVGDIKKLVYSIHNIGMKVILWYSMPFVGIHSKAYEEYKDMLLDGTGNGKDFFSLDPRYKKVRDYIILTYVNAVKEWNLDGLKLDFIDSFYLCGKSLEPDKRRDYESLEEALSVLLNDIKESLYVINPDFMIEFRQIYIGPALRKIGNMLRVSDCPGDAIKNRSNIIDMRLTSGKTPVHSDMLMWDLNASAQVGAMQIASSVFSVPQISMKLDKLPFEHLKMLSFYLGFWNEYREVLLDGKLTATLPEASYGEARSSLGNTEVIATYSENLITSDKPHTVIVNASPYTYFVIVNAENKYAKVLDYMGNIVSECRFEKRLNELYIPSAGIAFID